jgi:tetratricopeptide (TPR) repeat protein
MKAAESITKHPTASRWTRLRSALSLVREKSVISRQLILTDALRDSPSLLEEAELLARQREQMGSFLASLPETQEFVPSLQSGDIFAARFQVDAFMGAGAMGEVYRVQELHSNDVVALKLIRKELRADPELQERFKAELRLGRAVTSKNICPLYHFDEAVLLDGSQVAYFTMEYLVGQSLDDLLRSGPISLADAIPLIDQLLEGLEAAHQKEVLHGDLKCSNILLVSVPSRPNRLVITDFGMARSLIASDSSTLQAGLIMGTPAYMPREQIRGDALSPAADIHALGVIMFRMLTGSFPFAGDSAWETMRLRLETTALPPRQLNPEIPRPWSDVICKCLEAEPGNRIASVNELRKAIPAEAGDTNFRRRFLMYGTLASSVGLVAWWRNRKPVETLPAEALRSIALGEEFINRRGRDDYAKAVEEFEKAVRLVPNHAPAWIGLAQALAGQANWGMVPPAAALSKAQAAATTAVRLDPGNPRAHSTLGYCISIDVRRWLTADSHFDTALKLSPDEPAVLFSYASHLGRIGRQSDSIRFLERARMLAPQTLSVNHQLATEYWRAQRLDDFLRTAEELVRIQPTLGNSHLTLARALLSKNRLSEATAAVDEAERYRVDQPQLLQMRALLAVARTDSASALRIHRQLRQLWDQRPMEASIIAAIPAALADSRTAVEDLERGLAAGDSSVLSVHVHPAFRKIVNSPQMLTFLRKLGWPPI